MFSMSVCHQIIFQIGIMFKFILKELFVTMIFTAIRFFLFLSRNSIPESGDQTLQIDTGLHNPGMSVFTVAPVDRNTGISVMGPPPPPTPMQESSTTPKSLFNSMKKRNRSINFLVNVPTTFAASAGSGVNNNLQQKVKRIYL